jgi:membrane-bound serine protease (ClpP class)
LIGLGLKAQRRKVVTGIEGLTGATGKSLDILNPAGTVMVYGEIWNAESIEGIIQKGEKVRVTTMQNLKLYVEKINS